MLDFIKPRTEEAREQWGGAVAGGGEQWLEGGAVAGGGTVAGRESSGGRGAGETTVWGGTGLKPTIWLISVDLSLNV